MPPERPSEFRPTPGHSVWRWLVCGALVLFAFNFWAITLRHWPGALAYEVPSREALASGHWWTLLTYALTGTGIGISTQWISGPLSLLFFAMAARLVEENLLRRDFLWLCAVCAISAAVCWLPLHWGSGEFLSVGCTVLVLGLGSFLCFALPDEPLPLSMFVTVGIRPRAFFWFVLALETGAFLSFELPQVLGYPGRFQANFDYSANLGVMFAGWACACYWQRAHAHDELENYLGMPEENTAAVPVGAVRSVEAAKGTVSSRRELREAVDRILDKINHGGLESLDAQERQILNRAKDLLGK